MPLPELITNSPTLGSRVPLGTLGKAFNLGELTLELAAALPQSFWPTSTEEANWVQFHLFIDTEIVLVAATRDGEGHVTGAGKTFSCTEAGPLIYSSVLGSPVLSVSEVPATAAVGQPVTGAFIPAGSYITALSAEAKTITISQNAEQTEAANIGVYYNRCAEGSVGATHATGTAVWNELTAGALLGMLAYLRSVQELGRLAADGKAFTGESPHLVACEELICWGTAHFGLSSDLAENRFQISDGKIGPNKPFNFISVEAVENLAKLIGAANSRAQFTIAEYPPQRLTLAAPTPKRLTMTANGASIVLLTAEVEVTITSMRAANLEGAQRDGMCVTLINVSGKKINLESESAEGTASQRFKLVGKAPKESLVLSQDDAVALVYDATRARWVQRAALA